MTTTVKVTAHNSPTLVTVTEHAVDTGLTDYELGTDLELKQTPITVERTTERVLKAGQSWEGTVTQSQSIHVEEIETT